jgi:hypothetical protein
MSYISGQYITLPIKTPSILTLSRDSMTDELEQYEGGSNPALFKAIN